jgi:transcriptional antiterminator RfaH
LSSSAAWRASGAPFHSPLGRWHAVHTQPHREVEVENQLRIQGFVPFLPLCSKTVRHARRFRTARAAFFPRYLFVHLNPDRDRWRSVNGTYGVSRLVMAGDRPAPVPVGVVESLQLLTNSAGCISMQPLLQPGQKVRVLSGPFAEMIGELARVDASQRARVLLDIMGGRISVQIGGEALAAA